MTKADQLIADQIISHQLYLSRFTAGEQKKIFKLLLAMQTELKSKLLNGFTDYSKRRMLKLLNECTMVINEYYKEMQSKINYVAVAETELKATQKVFAAIGVEAAIPTSAAMKALVSDVLIEGSPAAAWWSKQAADTAFRFASQVRQGVAQNETMAQIVTRIVGSKKHGTPGIMDISRRNAYALVHTSIQQISNDARMATFQENADILEGMEQVSTLDSHTCWSPETKILMGDGREKPIGAIVPGDVVIGGTTGKPCKVLAVEKNVVTSSVETCYDERKIGRAAHGHKILTRSGWREIESICLLPDLHQREVLCRRYREASTQVAPTSNAIGIGRGVCAEQCVEEIRRPENDNPCRNGGSCSRVHVRKTLHQDHENEGPERVQHDGRRGGHRREIGRVAAGIRAKAEEEIFGGRCIPGENASLCGKSRAESIGSEQKVLCDKTRAGVFEEKNKFGMEREYSGCEQAPQNAGTKTGHAGCDKGQMEGPGISSEGEFGEGCKTGGTPGKRPTVGSEAKRGEIKINERAVEGPRISGKNDGQKACYCSEGITASRSRKNYEILDARESCYPGGEDKITVCETESVFGKFITGRIVAEQTEIVSLSIEGDNSYVAGGIIVHNSPTCMAYSGQQWDLNGNPIKGSELPYNGGCPRHYNCRSVIVPLLIPLSKIAGVELPAKPEGTRASDLGQIRESTTFNAFLQRHSTEYQDELLGKGRAEMWREGKITLSQLVNGSGRELTLSELKAKYN